MLTVINNQSKTIDSREVAEMVDKEHKNLLRDIQGYIKVIEDSSKLSRQDFFIESTYKNSQNKTQPCYLLTKQGCEMVANKMTGEKGILFTALYVDRFNKMENKQPIGIVESLHLELEASNKRIAELEQIVFAKQRRKLASKKHKLKIGSTLEQRLDNISNETVLEIIRTVLPVGTLRILDEGIAIDKKIVYKEVGRRHISKYDFNKKLKLLGIVVLSSEDYPYKQVRMNNTSMWCYVIKHNLIDN